MNIEYVFPKDTAFTCPHCNVYAQREKYSCEVKLLKGNSDNNSIPLTNPLDEIAPHSKVKGLTGSIECSACMACGFISLWIDNNLIFPTFPSGVPKPHEDMPEDIKNIYIEAGEISNKSPRSAAALLRLCLENLVNTLKFKGVNLKEKIENSGLPEKIQTACDSVRLYGNNAVHPGKIEIDDKAGTVTILFKIINYLIEEHIHIPKVIDEIYDPIPDTLKIKRTS